MDPIKERKLESIKVTYIGAKDGTSGQRARALQRLGLKVSFVHPSEWISHSRFVKYFHLKTGYFLAARLIKQRLYTEVATSRPDLIWVNQGELLGPAAVRQLRTLGAPIVNYANDNPFGAEFYRRFTQYRLALPQYDLAVVVFQQAVARARAAGARHVIRRFISADEVAHLAVGQVPAPKVYDVSFVGTWHPDGRGDAIRGLIRQGVPLSLWGDRWDRDRNWREIKKVWRGPGIYNESRYSATLASSRICLGLVNRYSGNQHTDRSTEIPAVGSLLCAERTQEHEMMYDDGKEAVFWTNTHECAGLCLSLLNDESRRSKIAAAGRSRALRNRNFNEPILAGILAELGIHV